MLGLCISHDNDRFIYSLLTIFEDRFTEKCVVVTLYFKKISHYHETSFTVSVSLVGHACSESRSEHR